MGSVLDRKQDVYYNNFTNHKIIYILFESIQVFLWQFCLGNYAFFHLNEVSGKFRQWQRAVDGILCRQEDYGKI